VTAIVVMMNEVSMMIKKRIWKILLDLLIIVGLLLTVMWIYRYETQRYETILEYNSTTGTGIVEHP